VSPALVKCNVPFQSGQFKYVDNSDGIIQPTSIWPGSTAGPTACSSRTRDPVFPRISSSLPELPLPPQQPLFASVNPKLSDPTGCIAPADQPVSLVDPDGDESTNAPIYPCYEHSTLTDVLNDAKVS